jgi:hypothetical protein
LGTLKSVYLLPKKGDLIAHPNKTHISLSTEKDAKDAFHFFVRFAIPPGEAAASTNKKYSNYNLYSDLKTPIVPP